MHARFPEIEAGEQKMSRRGPVTQWLVLWIVLFAAVAPLASQTYPPRPRDCILDEASLIKPNNAASIRDTCNKLLKETQIPIVVVTIPSLAKYKGGDIEAYARGLFDNWGIGSQERNYGVLLLVSVGDRKARIELGAAWAGAKDATARMIMNEIIVPNFKQGNYSAGILEGVQGLETMVRGELMMSPSEKRQTWIFLAVMAGGIFLGVSLIRSGRTGWGWAVLAMVGAVLVAVLVGAFSSRGRNRDSWGDSGGFGSGGFGDGGGFGGGSGGGGGATGSW
jgi:uncharacterized protein